MSNSNEQIRSILMEDTLESKFREFANYVIEDRAIPDIRDGLKPVQRRILFGADRLGLAYNRQHKKSARLTGEVIAETHPHGNVSVYDAMINLSQDFNMNIPLIDILGNNGNIDGDPAAAERYTECRKTELAEYFVEDLKHNTVNMIDNYDETSKEPVCLPTLIPNLLLNGTSGIAVSIATSVPPHNLKELYNVLYKAIDNKLKNKNLIDKDTTLVPDFPTGCSIILNNKNLEDVKDIYSKGKGRVIMQADYVIEDERTVVFTSVPYKVKKTDIVEHIDTIRQTEDSLKIREVRDESDKDGIRIVVSLKRGTSPNVVINNLFKLTKLRTSFSANMVALDKNKKPVIFNLEKYISEFIEHSMDISEKKIKNILKSLEDRLEILNANIIAHNNMDRIIEIIKESESDNESISNIMEEFEATKKQAENIVNTRLKSLSNINKQKVEEEIESVGAEIDKNNTIISTEENLLKYIKSEYKKIDKKFGTERKSQIINTDSEIEDIDLIEEESVMITISKNEIVKSIKTSDIRSFKGKSKGVSVSDSEDPVKYTFTCTTKDRLLIFTDKGRCINLYSYLIEISNRNNKGKHINNYIDIEPDEKIIKIIGYQDTNKDENLALVTKNGRIVKVKISEYVNNRIIKAINLDKEDELKDVTKTSEDEMLVIFTNDLKALKFKSSELINGSRSNKGYKAIKLRNNCIEKMISVKEDSRVIYITNLATGKSIDINKLTTKRRYMAPLVIGKPKEENEHLIEVLEVDSDQDNSEVLIVNEIGKTVKIKMGKFRKLSLTAMGNSLMNTKENIVGMDIVDE